mgnify:FL=1
MHVLLNIIVICVTVSQLNGFPTLKVDKSRPEENRKLLNLQMMFDKILCLYLFYSDSRNMNCQGRAWYFTGAANTWNRNLQSPLHH